MESVAWRFHYRGWLFLAEHQTLVITGAVYILGLAIAAVYAFSHNFTAVADAFQEYTLYNSYLHSGIINTFTNTDYQLQSHCLVPTLFPALLYHVFPIGELLFYKLYVVALCPLLPTAVYLLSSRVVRPSYAFAGSLLVMAQTTYIQSPSNFRTVIAIAFSVVLIGVIMYAHRYRSLLVVILSLLIVVSHYGVMFITGGIAGILLAVYLFQRRFKDMVPCYYALLILIVVGSLWHQWALHLLLFSSSASVAADTGKSSLTPGTGWLPGSATGQSGYDKIIQVAFGRTSFGDDTFTMSWGLFILSWLMLGISALGFIRTFLKKMLPIEVFVYGIVCAGAVVLMLIFPSISRIYGVERLWIQALSVIVPCFVLGFSWLVSCVTKRLWAVALSLSVFALVYFGFNYQYGLIKSIMG